MSTVGSMQIVWGIQGSAHHQSEHWLLPRQTDHPVSLFSSNVLPAESSKYRLHLSVHLHSNPSLHPPATHLRMTMLPSRTGQHPCLLLLPPSPVTFCGYQEGAGQKRGWRCSLHLRPGAQGGPHHGQSLQQCRKRNPGTFFLYPVTVISNQTQHLALSCLSCLCFIFSPLFLKGFSRRLLLTYHFVLQIWNYFYKIRILVPQANLNQESEPLFISNR